MAAFLRKGFGAFKKAPSEPNPNLPPVPRMVNNRGISTNTNTKNKANIQPNTYAEKVDACIQRWEELLDASAAYICMASDTILETENLCLYDNAFQVQDIAPTFTYLTSTIQTQAEVTESIRKIVNSLKAARVHPSRVTQTQMEVNKTLKQRNTNRDHAHADTSKDHNICSKTMAYTLRSRQQFCEATYAHEIAKVNQNIFMAEFGFKMTAALAQGSHDLLLAERKRTERINAILSEYQQDVQESTYESYLKTKSQVQTVIQKRKQALAAAQFHTIYSFGLTDAQKVSIFSESLLNPARLIEPSVGATIYKDVMLTAGAQVYVGSIILTMDMLHFHSYTWDYKESKDHTARTSELKIPCVVHGCSSPAVRDVFHLHCSEHALELDLSARPSLDLNVCLGSITRIRDHQCEESPLLPDQKRCCIVWTKELCCYAFNFLNIPDKQRELAQFIDRLNIFTFKEEQTVYRVKKFGYPNVPEAVRPVFPLRYRYDADSEFTRMGILGNKLFRKTLINSTYARIPTYSAVLFVPSGASEQTLLGSISFRSKGRIPALSWRAPWAEQKEREPVMFRASQPAVGLRNARSVEDEMLIGSYVHVSPVNQRKEGKSVHGAHLVIADCRPKLNALGNKAKGFGTEDVSNYPGCSLSYLGIANIHTVRNSLHSLRIHHTHYNLSPQGVWTNEELYAMNPVQNPTLWAKLASHSWYMHLASVLTGAVETVLAMRVYKQSVFVHCSDGWDRTAQICSLAQLLMDPYFRTLEGFCCLIEKEWCNFGHKFAERTGSAPQHRENFRDKERSPIFLQFIDACYQIITQFPTDFEYNPRFLLELLDEVHNNRFRTFVADCEKTRTEQNFGDEKEDEQHVPSVWAYLLHPRVRPYLTNPLYAPKEVEHGLHWFRATAKLETHVQEESSLGEAELERIDTTGSVDEMFDGPRRNSTSLLANTDPNAVPAAATTDSSVQGGSIRIIARDEKASAQLKGPDPLIPACKAANLKMFLPLFRKWDVTLTRDGPGDLYSLCFLNEAEYQAFSLSRPPPTSPNYNNANPIPSIAPPRTASTTSLSNNPSKDLKTNDSSSSSSSSESSLDAKKATPSPSGLITSLSSSSPSKNKPNKTNNPSASAPVVPPRPSKLVRSAKSPAPKHGRNASEMAMLDESKWDRDTPVMPQRPEEGSMMYLRGLNGSQDQDTQEED